MCIHTVQYILYSTYNIDDDVKCDCQPLLAGGGSRVVTPICLVRRPIGLVLQWWCSRFTISLHSIPRASPLVHRCIAHTRWCPSPPLPLQLVLPPWPMFRRHPLQWLPSEDSKQSGRGSAGGGGNKLGKNDGTKQPKQEAKRKKKIYSDN